jgi:hypothetical protein
VKYANGKGVMQDHVEAVKWYRLAADQGQAIAQFNLGGIGKRRRSKQQPLVVVVVMMVVVVVVVVLPTSSIMSKEAAPTENLQCEHSQHCIRLTLPPSSDCDQHTAIHINLSFLTAACTPSCCNHPPPLQGTLHKSKR